MSLGLPPGVDVVLPQLLGKDPACGSVEDSPNLVAGVGG